MPHKDPEARRAYHRAYDKAWGAKHHEKLLAKHRAYEQKRKNDPAMMEKRREADRRRIRPEAHSVQKAEFYKANKARWFDGRLRKAYGISLADYEALVSAQAGRCASCGTADPLNRYGKFHTDHDHATGVVRGLLCRPCNLTIGHAKESIERLRYCVSYLERTTAKIKAVS